MSIIFDTEELKWLTCELLEVVEEMKSVEDKKAIVNKYLNLVNSVTWEGKEADKFKFSMKEKLAKALILKDFSDLEDFSKIPGRFAVAAEDLLL